MIKNLIFCDCDFGSGEIWSSLHNSAAAILFTYLDGDLKTYSIFHIPISLSLSSLNLIQLVANYREFLLWPTFVIWTTRKEGEQR